MIIVLTEAKKSFFDRSANGVQTVKSLFKGGPKHVFLRVQVK